LIVAFSSFLSISWFVYSFVFSVVVCVFDCLIVCYYDTVVVVKVLFFD